MIQFEDDRDLQGFVSFLISRMMEDYMDETPEDLGRRNHEEMEKLESWRESHPLGEILRVIITGMKYNSSVSIYDYEIEKLLEKSWDCVTTYEDCPQTPFREVLNSKRKE